MKIGIPGGSSPRRENRKSISRRLSTAESARQLLTERIAANDAHATVTFEGGDAHACGD
jgi:hypothetical protein